MEIGTAQLRFTTSGHRFYRYCSIYICYIFIYLFVCTYIFYVLQFGLFPFYIYTFFIFLFFDVSSGVSIYRIEAAVAAFRCCRCVVAVVLRVFQHCDKSFHLIAIFR